MTGSFTGLSAELISDAREISTCEGLLWMGVEETTRTAREVCMPWLRVYTVGLAIQEQESQAWGRDTVTASPPGKGTGKLQDDILS